MAFSTRNTFYTLLALSLLCQTACRVKQKPKTISEVIATPPHASKKVTAAPAVLNLEVKKTVAKASEAPATPIQATNGKPLDQKGQILPKQGVNNKTKKGVSSKSQAQNPAVVPGATEKVTTNEKSKASDKSTGKTISPFTGELHLATYAISNAFNQFVSIKSWQAYYYENVQYNYGRSNVYRSAADSYRSAAHFYRSAAAVFTPHSPAAKSFTAAANNFTKTHNNFISDYNSSKLWCLGQISHDSDVATTFAFTATAFTAAAAKNDTLKAAAAAVSKAAAAAVAKYQAAAKAVAAFPYSNQAGYPYIKDNIDSYAWQLVWNRADADYESAKQSARESIAKDRGDDAYYNFDKYLDRYPFFKEATAVRDAAYDAKTAVKAYEEAVQLAVTAISNFNSAAFIKDGVDLAAFQSE